MRRSPNTCLSKNIAPALKSPPAAWKNDAAFPDGLTSVNSAGLMITPRTTRRGWAAAPAERPSVHELKLSGRDADAHPVICTRGLACYVIFAAVVVLTASGCAGRDRISPSAIGVTHSPRASATPSPSGSATPLTTSQEFAAAAQLRAMSPLPPGFAHTTTCPGDEGSASACFSSTRPVTPGTSLDSYLGALGFRHIGDGQSCTYVPLQSRGRKIACDAFGRIRDWPIGVNLISVIVSGSATPQTTFRLTVVSSFHENCYDAPSEQFTICVNH